MAPTNFLTVSIASYNFGTVPLNSFATCNILLSNTSDTTINITAFNGLSAPLTSNGTPITLTTGQSTTIIVTFNPIAASSYSQTLAIVNSGITSPNNVVLSGVGFSNIYSLPDINNLACGVVKCKLITGIAIPDLTGLIPTKVPFLNIGVFKESIDMEVGFTEINNVDITVAEDYSTCPEGFWHRLINGYPLSDIELMFSIMEGSDDTFLFRGVLNRQEATNTEYYLDVLSGTPTKWVRGIKFTLISSLKVLQNVSIAALITECKLHKIASPLLSNYYVVPLGEIVASMIKLAYGTSYDSSLCVNNSTDIQIGDATETIINDWNIAALPIALLGSDIGFFDSTVGNTGGWYNRFANAYDLLKNLCFTFGIIPRYEYGTVTGIISVVPTLNNHRLVFVKGELI